MAPPAGCPAVADDAPPAARRPGIDRTRHGILLVHPLGYRVESAPRDISRLANIMPPLGLASIAAYLEKRGIDCQIIDCHAHPDDLSIVRQRAREYRPSFLGISCTTSSFLDGVRIAGMVRTEVPKIQTVFGGPHVSALGDPILREFRAVDFVVVGEGEQTLAELVLSGGEAPEEIEGLLYRGEDGEPHFTGYRSGLDLDSLPFPSYEKLAGYPADYKLPIFNYPRVPNTSCISSRGCPYACSYCDRSVFRRTFRYNSADYLYEHLAYLRERFGIRHVNFYDDQFTFHRERVLEFCGRMVDRPLGMTFNCAVRAEHIDTDLLRALKGAGCWMASVGIETGDAELLAHHRQNANLEMLAEKVRDIKRAGIRTKGLLMLGLPGETVESVRKSMEYVFSLPIDDINVAKFTPFPGSPLYAKVRELGAFEEDWERMDCMSFCFVPNTIRRAELETLFTEFYRRHFTRPKVLAGYAAMLWRSPDSWRRFARNLGSFLRFARTDERLGG